MTDTIQTPTESPATAETVKPASLQAVGDDRIRARAYELYEKRNGGPGDAESDWYRAQSELGKASADTA